MMPRRGRAHRRWSQHALVAALVCATAAAPLAAQESDSEPSGSSEWGAELKVHYRNSQDRAFPSPFPFPPEFLPPGETRGFLETVEPGDQVDLSVITLWHRGSWANDRWSSKVKVDLIDLHDRNPTSSDNEFDLDEAWIRFGRELEPGTSPEPGRSGYVKVGKMPKFERQDDRHLESYGLVSTAFNRMEDVGLEVGGDFGRFYVKGAVSQGNPVFLRDPNQLAGDQGTPILLEPFPTAERGTGFSILYDADVELDGIDFAEPEIGLGIGARLGPSSGTWQLDLLAWGYQRDLAETVELEGTFYGADLDLLRGPGNAFPLDLVGREKEEFGLNLWLYAGGLSVFGQYVDQEIAGLPRDGFEVEVAYEWELPYLGALWGRQLFPFVAPAIRYSELDVEVTGNPQFPAVSVRWDWEKIDAGVRMGLLQGLADMTVEYASNRFERLGQWEHADEFLVTVRVEAVDIF